MYIFAAGPHRASVVTREAEEPCSIVQTQWWSWLVDVITKFCETTG